MIFIHNVSGVTISIIFWVIGAMLFGTTFLSIPGYSFGILFVWIVLGIPYTICLNRTFILSPQGLTIYFLGYKKTYLWEQLKCKRVEDCSNYRSRDYVRYKRLVTLSVVNRKKRKVLPPSSFGDVFFLFRHFSCAFSPC